MSNRHRKKRPSPLPALWLMTDERVEATALLAAAGRLPKGRAGIVFRHYRTAPAARRALFDALRVIARRRRLVLLLAGDARLAAAWRADGVHGDAGRVSRALIFSRAVHDRQQAVAARGADLCFVSPPLSDPIACRCRSVGPATLCRVGAQDRCARHGIGRREG